VCGRLGAPAPADIIVKSMGPDPRIGHYPGAGPLPAHAPILIKGTELYGITGDLFEAAEHAPSGPEKRSARASTPASATASGSPSTSLRCSAGPGPRR
jgi:hypothetical protein